MPTLRELIAGNFARLRADAQVPPERVAEAATRFGLDWTVSWLKGVEHGSRALNGEQLLMLPIVLTSALAQRVCLADLLRGDEPIVVADQQIAAAQLREAVTGAPTRGLFATVAPDATTLVQAAATQAVEKMRIVREANLGNVDMRTLGRAEAGAGEAEVKLARKLGVHDIVVIAASAALWGQSLSEERDAQVRRGEDKNAVTRKLTAALTDHIAQAKFPEPEIL